VLFAVVFAIPAVAWWGGQFNPILAFWPAYVVTRPLGASFADGFSKPCNGGLGWSDGTVSGLALIVFAVLVAYVAITKRDVQQPVAPAAHHPHLPHPELGPTSQRQPAENLRRADTSGTHPGGQLATSRRLKTTMAAISGGSANAADTHTALTIAPPPVGVSNRSCQHFKAL
jgi:hypothetical protein